MSKSEKLKPVSWNIQNIIIECDTKWLVCEWSTWALWNSLQYKVNNRRGKHTEDSIPPLPDPPPPRACYGQCQYLNSSKLIKVLIRAYPPIFIYKCVNIKCSYIGNSTSVQLPIKVLHAENYYWCLLELLEFKV